METPRKIAQNVKNKTRKMDSNEIMQRRQKRLASAESSNNLPKINFNLSKEEMCMFFVNFLRFLQFVNARDVVAHYNNSPVFANSKTCINIRGVSICLDG